MSFSHALNLESDFIFVFLHVNTTKKWLFTDGQKTSKKHERTSMKLSLRFLPNVDGSCTMVYFINIHEKNLNVDLLPTFFEKHQCNIYRGLHKRTMQCLYTFLKVSMKLLLMLDINIGETILDVFVNICNTQQEFLKSAHLFKGKLFYKL